MGDRWFVVPIYRDQGEGWGGIEILQGESPYQVVDGVIKFIFFMDKDFDYIEVLSYDCNHCEYRIFVA